MKADAVKLELIRWIIELKDKKTLRQLLNIKRSWELKDWDETLSAERREQIEEGLRDIKAGRIIKSADVWKKYGRA